MDIKNNQPNDLQHKGSKPEQKQKSGSRIKEFDPKKNPLTEKDKDTNDSKNAAVNKELDDTDHKHDYKTPVGKESKNKSSGKEKTSSPGKESHKSKNQKH